MNGRTEGMALVLSLGLLLALGVLTLGLVYVGAQQVLIARARGAWLRARLGAESAARAAVAGWNTSAFRDLPVGGSRPAPGGAGVLPGGVRHEATVERLAGSLYLVRGEGRSGEGGATRAVASVGLLVRGLEPRELWADFPAAVSSGGQVVARGGAEVDGLDAAAPPPPWPDDLCPARTGEDPWSTLLGPTARPGIVVPTAADASTVGATILGDPPIVVDPDLSDSTAFARLGPLTWEDLEAVADHVASGALDLAPRYRDGACDTTARGNWGAPLDPGGPCGDFFPLVFAPGDLTVRTGAGQGVLVVGGDLVLEPGVRFFGPVLARGKVLVLEGAAIYGAARAGSRAGSSVLDGGAVAYRACAIGRALERSPGLNRAFRPRGRSWIPVF